MSRSILADLPNGAIVSVKAGYGRSQRWGVLCRELNQNRKRGHLVVDFWDGGREWVRESMVVEVV